MHHRARAFCLALTVLPALQPTLALADDPPGLVNRWTFDTPADGEGWSIGHDLKDLHVADGVLRMTTTGSDAFFFAPPVDVPLEGCVVRIRLRGQRDGTTQVYWATATQPDYNEARVISKLTRAAGLRVDPDHPDEFITVEYPIGQGARPADRLTGFRIDPYNALEPGVVEIDSVELFRPPPIVEPRLSHQRHWVDVDEEVRVRAVLRHVAGRRERLAYAAELPGNARAALDIEPGSPSEAAASVRYAEPGVHRAEASLVLEAEASTAFTLESSMIVGRGERLPVTPLLRSDRVRVSLIPTADRKRFGAARWEVARAPGDWVLAGWLMPLAQLAVRTESGHVFWREPFLTLDDHTQRTARLRGALDDGGPWTIEVDLKLIEREGREAVEVNASLEGPEGGRLLSFTGPTLLADRQRADDLLDRHALFGGLEFLEPGWPSSSDRAVGDRYADRWTPHPFKVTLPVMAVEAEGVTSALMWQPTDAWTPDETMPTATFASPNFLDDQPNHLMRISAPSIPRWAEENETLARQPFAITREPVTLRCLLYAECDLPVAMTSRRWYELFGVPTQPSRPHDDREMYDIVARNYGETMFWPDEKGWRHHWWHSETSSSFVPFMAGELIAHAADTGTTTWIEKTGLTGRTLIDTVGTLASRLAGDAYPRQLISTMRPDGTWPFANTPEMRQRTREFTQNKYDSLGEDGSTSLGTCVQPALPILRHAKLSGDKACIDAGVKALTAMRQFRVPRGAQVWEVHQMIPDIRAAALAIEAYTLGYQITGDPQWLDDAAYWAWAGVPFLYSWRVPMDQVTAQMVASRDKNNPDRTSMPLSEGFQNPNREVTPFASVPVLGPTFYVINWYGVIVQWCGLEWAWKVIELDHERSDPLLRYVADGVVLSGLQQMFDKPPWVGLYPDVWDTQLNRAYGAFICSVIPMHCLEAQGRLPPWTEPWTRVLRNGDQRWHVSGWGRPVKLAEPDTTWTATIEFLEDQPNELLIAGVEGPRSVRLDDKLLAPQPSPGTTGWKYDSDRRALLVRFTQDTKRVNIQVGW